MFAILDITEHAQNPELWVPATIDDTDKVSLPDSGQVSEGEDEINMVTLDDTKDDDTKEMSSSSSSSSSSSQKDEKASLDTCKYIIIYTKSNNWYFFISSHQQVTHDVQMSVVGRASLGSQCINSKFN